MFGNKLGAPSLKLERLECREVPAANVTLQGQVLVITGDARDNTVLVFEMDDQVVVNVDGQVQAPIASDALQAIVFSGGSGNDVLINGSSVYTFAQGGNGADTLMTGSGGGVLIGGTGHDVLIGGTGDDTILGEVGNDVLFGGAGVDILLGGVGRDRFLDEDRTNDAFDDSFLDLFEGGGPGVGNGNGNGRGNGR